MIIIQQCYICTYIQNHVFGAGYPSLPTVSLEEFYQQKYKEQVEQQKRYSLQLSFSSIGYYGLHTLFFEYAS